MPDRLLRAAPPGDRGGLIWEPSVIEKVARDADVARDANGYLAPASLVNR